MQAARPPLMEPEPGWLCDNTSRQTLEPPVDPDHERSHWTHAHGVEPASIWFSRVGQHVVPPERVRAEVDPRISRPETVRDVEGLGPDFDLNGLGAQLAARCAVEVIGGLGWKKAIAARRKRR